LRKPLFFLLPAKQMHMKIVLSGLRRFAADKPGAQFATSVYIDR